MEIKHIPFDIPKQLCPISATKIRNDLFTHWKFLPNSVKADFAIKVVILGTESTGKTTMTEKLAQYYNCTAIKEAARDIIADSNSFEYDDLKMVAIEHAQQIDKAVVGKSALSLLIQIFILQNHTQSSHLKRNLKLMIISTILIEQCCIFI